MPTPNERYSEIMKEIRALDAQGVLDTASATRMAELITEGKTVRSQIEQRKEVASLEDFGRSSAGAIPLATPATVESIRPAGETVLTNRSDSLLAEQYGEGLWDPKVRAITASKEYHQAFRSWLRTPASGTTDASAIRTLQEGADVSGGFLVPEDILDQVISKVPTPTRVAGRVTQLQTGRDSVVIPKVNYNADDIYTTGMRVTWTGEIPASSTAMRVTDPVFGQERISVYTAMMSIPVTNDMIEDSSFPLVSYLAGKFNETVEILRDNMILNGTGQGQPAGLLINPGTANNPAVTVSATSGTLAGSDLVSIAMSLPEQYDDNAAWIFNKTSTAQAIAELKDTNGRFLWGAGLQDSGLEMGFKDRMLVGYPVVLSGLMPNVAASAYPILFGDFRGYYLVNRIGFSIQILREIYAETNQVLILGRVRFGGLLAEPWKVKALQIHA